MKHNIFLYFVYHLEYMLYTSCFTLGELSLEKTPLSLGLQLKYSAILTLLKGWSGAKNFLFMLSNPLPALVTPIPELSSLKAIVNLVLFLFL